MSAPYRPLPATYGESPAASLAGDRLVESHRADERLHAVRAARGPDGSVVAQVVGHLRAGGVIERDVHVRSCSVVTAELTGDVRAGQLGSHLGVEGGDPEASLARRATEPPHELRDGLQFALRGLEDRLGCALEGRVLLVDLHLRVDATEERRDRIRGGEGEPVDVHVADALEQVGERDRVDGDDAVQPCLGTLLFPSGRHQLGRAGEVRGEVRVEEVGAELSSVGLPLAAAQREHRRAALSEAVPDSLLAHGQQTVVGVDARPRPGKAAGRPDLGVVLEDQEVVPRPVRTHHRRGRSRAQSEPTPVPARRPRPLRRRRRILT